MLGNTTTREIIVQLAPATLIICKDRQLFYKRTSRRAVDSEASSWARTDDSKSWHIFNWISMGCVIMSCLPGYDPAFEGFSHVGMPEHSPGS